MWLLCGDGCADGCAPAARCVAACGRTAPRPHRPSAVLRGRAGNRKAANPGKWTSAVRTGPIPVDSGAGAARRGAAAPFQCTAVPRRWGWCPSAVAAWAEPKGSCGLTSRCQSAGASSPVVEASESHGAAYRAAARRYVGGTAELLAHREGLRMAELLAHREGLRIDREGLRWRSLWRSRAVCLCARARAERDPRSGGGGE
jgi:hypothetical protein